MLDGGGGLGGVEFEDLAAPGAAEAVLTKWGLDHESAMTTIHVVKSGVSEGGGRGSAVNVVWGE